jgi:hypothetical protein
MSSEQPARTPADRIQVRFWAWSLSTIFAFADIAQAQEDPKDIVAVAVRQNGYVCENPKSVKPDIQQSAPDEKAWILSCEVNTYFVKFKGDAQVEVRLISD